MKVALVQMPVWWTVDPPLGLAQMAGCLKATGHEPLIFDLNVSLWKSRQAAYANFWLWEQFHLWNQPAVVDRFFAENRLFIEKEVEDILRRDARIIGFSVANGSRLASLAAAALIKKADPTRVVVFGGQQFFLNGKLAEVLGTKVVDAVVRGNAEETFPALVGDVERTGRIIPRNGVAFRSGNGMNDGGLSPVLKNLDQTPFADFTGFPLEAYSDQERLPMAASRGCVWACRFCSSRTFWNEYRYMSGDRVFAEVLHHRRLFPKRRHVDFYDITANGRPEALRRFAELVKEHDWYFRTMEIGWKINAIFRPEMTADYLSALNAGGCKEIIYGIESGSPAVLRRMNKHYDLPMAERILKETHAAGITTTGNFMFGFPGETEKDFELTLEFLRRNADSMHRAYASATFTSLEENSYLTEHQTEFDIRPSGSQFHSLYWESTDGKNTYPVRLDRCIRFRELAVELGLEAYKGVEGGLEEERLFNLVQYHRYRDDRLRNVESLCAYLEIDPDHRGMQLELERYLEDLEKLPGLCAALVSWETRTEGLAALRDRIWKFIGERLTDDEPFTAETSPELIEWFSANGSCRPVVEEIIALHARLQTLNHHALIRKDGARFFVYYGIEPLRDTQKIKDLIVRGEKSSSRRQDKRLLGVAL